MLTITADVNGKVIGRVWVHNVTPPKTELVRKCPYEICLYHAAIDTGDDMVLGIENVIHFKRESWFCLLQKVFKKVPGFVTYWE